MENIKEFTEETLLSDETFIALFGIEDSIQRARTTMELTRRAKELKIKSDFDLILNSYQKVEKEMNKESNKTSISSLENYTNFTGPYDAQQCKGWIATDEGVYSMMSGDREELACYHPILPIERLKNLETGSEQIKLAYKRKGNWNEIIIPKTMIASANKIVGLSEQGIAVTSENARLLVKYLADVENANDDYIDVQYSTSKLGWIKDTFVPFDKDIVFDGDHRFKQVYESINQVGELDIWLEHMKELRATGRMETKMLLAASFSSVLVKLLGGLPYIVDLWGETEGGKTVSLMIAASVWANPSENAYIGDFKSTEVALEAKMDMLNNLPMLLDDTSKTSSRIRDNFEEVVYDLCSGKGKSRSNKDLGVARENRWKNCVICNGEKPLSSYVEQGGAINRILEVECGSTRIYENPRKTADIIKDNYGWGGRLFIELINALGLEKIKAIQEEILAELQDDDKMQKQSASLSMVLTADRIATEYIFKDDAYISLDEAKKVLTDRNMVSDNDRCYRYIIDKVGMNSQRFAGSNANCEQWGFINDGYAIFYPQAFEQICKDGGSAKQSFLTWADKKGFLQTQGGRLVKAKKIGGRTIRCVWLKIDESYDENGFKQIEQELIENPFK